jgi:hypothetical protein
MGEKWTDRLLVRVRDTDLVPLHMLHLYRQRWFQKLKLWSVVRKKCCKIGWLFHSILYVIVWLIFCMEWHLSHIPLFIFFNFASYSCKNIIGCIWKCSSMFIWMNSFIFDKGVCDLDNVIQIRNHMYIGDTLTNYDLAIITYLLTYGAEPFLRSRQLCSPSSTSQHFMEPEGSTPCSQEPSTDPYPEPYQSNPLYPILSL